MKLKIENATKYRQKLKIRQNADKKPLRFRLCGCKYVCVYGCRCMCLCVDVCFYVKLGQERKALVIAVNG